MSVFKRNHCISRVCENDVRGQHAAQNAAKQLNRASSIDKRRCMQHFANYPLDVMGSSLAAECNKCDSNPRNACCSNRFKQLRAQRVCRNCEACGQLCGTRNLWRMSTHSSAASGQHVLPKALPAVLHVDRCRWVVGGIGESHPLRAQRQTRMVQLCAYAAHAAAHAGAPVIGSGEANVLQRSLRAWVYAVRGGAHGVCWN